MNIWTWNWIRNILRIPQHTYRVSLLVLLQSSLRIPHHYYSIRSWWRQGFLSGCVRMWSLRMCSLLMHWSSRTVLYLAECMLWSLHRDICGIFLKILSCGFLFRSNRRICRREYPQIELLFRREVCGQCSRFHHSFDFSFLMKEGTSGRIRTRDPVEGSMELQLSTLRGHLNLNLK